jgi:phage shock protein E
MSIIPGLIYVSLIGGAILSNNKLNYISVKEASIQIKKKKFDYILDVRTKEEYDEGHLPNVILYESLDKDKIIKDIPDFYSKILIYCRSGNRSKKAGDILRKYGYANIYVVINGGYAELIKED